MEPSLAETYWGTPKPRCRNSSRCHPAAIVSESGDATGMTIPLGADVLGLRDTEPDPHTPKGSFLIRRYR